VACDCGSDLVYADFHDVRQYRDAVLIARDHGTSIGLASVRIQKPAEMGLLRVLRRLQPDWVLARNLAAIAFCKEQSIPVIADFSLNVANHRSAEWIRSIGAKRVTASYDLNREQILGLIESVPPSWLEVVLHQHMPMFHMEHCVYCAVLSPGTNKTNCGRPCDRHEVKLRDRVGAEHLLEADVACRNTLYNATPQSGAEIASDLIRRNVRWFRIELLDEDPEKSGRTIQLYRKLLSGEVPAREVWRRLHATNRLGVTRGTLESNRNPLAIL
jgi:putative protease